MANVDAFLLLLSNLCYLVLSFFVVRNVFKSRSTQRLCKWFSSIDQKICARSHYLWL